VPEMDTSRSWVWGSILLRSLILIVTLAFCTHQQEMGG
jgi:hypothetical protein